METLNEDDLDWLTKVENRLLSMRKRETTNTNFFLTNEWIANSIKEIHSLRQSLQHRFNKAVDKDL